MPTDPEELERQASLLAASDQTPDHNRLLSLLRSGDFLRQLDPPETLLGPRESLRVGSILEQIAENPPAHVVLVLLTLDPGFHAAMARAELLIEALTSVRPSPREAIRFWDDHCRPNDCFSNLTMRALAQNGSGPALALFEQKMAYTYMPEEDRKYWAAVHILVRRNDPAILGMSERLLMSDLPPSLKSRLVDVLFDYRPNEWYDSCRVFNPPPRTGLTREGATLLRKVGQFALASIDLDSRSRQTVQRTLDSLPES